MGCGLIRFGHVGEERHQMINTKTRTSTGVKRYCDCNMNDKFLESETLRKEIGPHNSRKLAYFRSEAQSSSLESGK